MKPFIWNEYIIQTKIGAGSCGTVYKGITQSTSKPVAIKAEKIQQAGNSKLEKEVLLLTNYLGRVKGVPRVKSSGKHEEKFYAVMNLLGESLENLLEQQKWQLSLKTTLQVFVQLLKRLKKIHSLGVVHRDLKPDNILFGTGKRTSRAYIIDFSLSTHISEVQRKRQKTFVGSVGFCSMRSHSGVPQLYRDDLESLAYIAVLMRNGVLPWMLEMESNERPLEDNVCYSKKTTPISLICQGLPEEFAEFLTYARGLSSEEAINYDLWIQKFTYLGNKLNITFDNVYDWSETAAALLRRSKPSLEKQETIASTLPCIPPKLIKNPVIIGLEFVSDELEDAEDIGLKRNYEDGSLTPPTSRTPILTPGVKKFLDTAKDCELNNHLSLSTEASPLP